MKNFIIIIAMLLYAISGYSQQPVIKIYQIDGSSKQYKIEDIVNLSFIHSNLSYRIKIYNKNTGLKGNYDIRVIDSIWIENNNMMKISIGNKISELNMEESDSIIIDWNTCEEIQIGNQIWMCRNLDVSHYRNGDSIPEVRDSVEWSNLETGAWCYYNNSDSIGKIYGKLYNWYAVNDPRGLAPEGWHVATIDEWNNLINYLGGNEIAGGKLKEPGIIHWNNPNIDATNENGFTALPGGDREDSGLFNEVGLFSNLWTSSFDNIGDISLYISNKYTFIFSTHYSNSFGFSVRCIRYK
jgi:uncharacterized protein (TIGR02145 family)